MKIKKELIQLFIVFLFEQKGKSLYIHEITADFHKVFIKESKKSRKKLIETRKRRKLLQETNLASFITN